MDVAYLCADPGIPLFGTKGASVHIQEIVRAFRASGATVRMYCTRRGTDVPADLADLQVTEHRVPRAEGAGREAAQAQAAAALAEAVIADGADLVYERYSLFSTALEDISTRLQIPSVLEVNAPLIDEQRTYRQLYNEVRARNALRQQAAAATQIVCVSAPIAQWVRQHAPDAGGRLAVVPNGVNVSRIQPARDAGGIPVVVFVGTLKPWHGVEVLLEAAARAREDWRLRIIGDGPEGPALRKLAEALGVDVEFTGALVPELMPAVLADCAIAVAPYPATEHHEQQYFSPLKIYEYCAAGLAVVASRVGQVPRILEDGVTGVLVRPSDPAALASAIDMLAVNPSTRRRIAAAARHIAVELHSWETVLAKILDGITLHGIALVGVRP